MQPGQFRTTILDEDDGLHIIIPEKPHWFVRRVLQFWLISGLSLWGVCVLSFIGPRISGTAGSPGDLSNVIMGFCGIPVAFVASIGVGIGFWILGSRETILLNEESFILRKEVFGVGRSRKFHVRDIGDLSYSANNYHAIALVVGANVFRFGFNLEQPEAQRIIEVIKQRIPQLNRVPPCPASSLPQCRPSRSPEQNYMTTDAADKPTFDA
jgi:hypothetical protein